MGKVTQAQLAEWRNTIGRTETRNERLDPGAVGRFARAAGLDDVNGPIPLEHWAHFLPSPADDEIGPDGHPRRGEFLPDISLPRRMFAASHIEFIKAPVVGRLASQSSCLADIALKAGSSGELIFALVERRIEQDGHLCIRENQTYVFRDKGPELPMPQPLPAAPEGEKWQPDEVNLFRFSAATCNSHRIHYDLQYTKAAEGYPALIVHGPFTALKLAELAMRHGDLASFSFRANAPIFLGQPVYLGANNPGHYEAIRCDGLIAMTAEASFK